MLYKPYSWVLSVIASGLWTTSYIINITLISTMSDPGEQNCRYIHKGRLTLMEKDHPYGGPTRYYYADNLSFVAKLYTVLSVIGSILSTPLVLLCCIPTIISIKKTQKLVEEGDIEAARKEFRVSYHCRLLAWIWAAIIGPLIFVPTVYGLSHLIVTQRRNV